MWSSRGLCVFLVLAIPAASELTMSIYNNSAMHGQPITTQALAGLNFSILREQAFSAEVTGQLVYDQESFYAFDCSFVNAQIAMVWVGDHLICNTKPPFGATPGSTDGTRMYPLMGKAGEAVPLVIHVYNAEASADKIMISVKWAHLGAAVAHDKPVNFEDIPKSALLASLPPLELKRRELQQSTKQGWNTWSYNMLGVVRLPESCDITSALCRLSTGDCLLDTHIEDNHASVRVGMFATDLSYWHFYLGYKGINVSMSYSGGNGFSMLAEPVNCASVDCSDYVLVVLPSFKWERVGNVSIATDNASLTLGPLGMKPVTIRLTRQGSVVALPKAIPADAPAIILPLNQGAIGLQDDVSSAGSAPTVSSVRKVISNARTREVARIAKFTNDEEGGDRFTTKEGLQAATMWNYIYTPAEYGPILPVSRSWNFVTSPVNDDWSYVIFDWDNIFASYMTSMDPTSKDIAYTNFIQVIRSRTAKGFVPNYAAGGRKSVDRTEPPIGAKVLLEMYRRYGDKWLVELLFDDLVGWSDWFLRERILQPAGLVALGSDFIDGYHDYNPNAMSAARLESGLDNSPMYDGDFFNKTSQLMQLYDVGFSSMFVQEARCLAELAKIIGRSADVSDMLNARAADMQKRISENLWDSVGGIYTNKFSNGTFYRRISPTSFYAMMAHAATDDQAAAMVTNWLHSPDHFCVAPNGDFKGNKDTCFWGLPSIQASDVAFPPLGYWRGYVWGPMAQLTYWSLQEYDHVPEVRNGRKALCKQMNELMLWQWRKNRHICENYSPHRTADDHHGDCSGTKFYHWGALTGMISLIEQGYYNSSGASQPELLLL